LRTTRAEVESQKRDSVIVGLVADCRKAALALAKIVK